MARLVCLLVCLLPGLYACAADQQPEQANSPVVQVTPVPSPQPAGYDGEAPERRAMAAALTERDLTERLGPGTYDIMRGSTDLQPCPVDLVSENWTDSGYLVKWKSRPDTESAHARVMVDQYIVGFWRWPASQVLLASDVIMEIRARATCDSYEFPREGPQEMRRELPLPAVEGVDATLGYCERARSGNQGSCTIYLAVDEILSKVRVVAATEEVARGQVLKLLDPAAHRLREID